MNLIDYIIIGSYLIFLMGMGPAFRSFSRNASDFFRAGGTMIWWVAGSSVFMTGFTAWSFTGGAAKAYETGFFFLLLFACNLVAGLITYWLFAARFRQMRVMTPVEAIRRRYGRINEQVYTWLPFPLGILNAGISLYILAIFISAVFPALSMDFLVITLGVTVVVIATIGGAWAAHGSDFVQMLIFLIITVIMVLLTLNHPDINGIQNLLANLPPQHLDWTKFNRTWIIILFAVTLLVNQIIQGNTLNGTSAKYLLVKDGPDAKRAALMSIISMIVCTPLWIIPPLASTIVHPNLSAEYPNLHQPNDAAYIAMAITVLPTGLLGLLICGIFSATLTSLTAQLNWNAGILIRNFYLPILNPMASEKMQVILGKAVTLVYGIAIIVTGLLFARFNQLKLFDLVLLLAASTGIPQAVPMCLGVWIKRAPSWAGWSTLLIGLVVSLFLRWLLTPERIRYLFPTDTPLTQNELVNLDIALTTLILLTVCITWFTFSTAVVIGLKKWRENHPSSPNPTPVSGVLLKLFEWLVDSPKRQQEVDEFFRDMNSTIDHAEQHVNPYESDSKQCRVLGMMSLVYGLFIACMALMPNTPDGRVGLLSCGLIIGMVGILLLMLQRKYENKRNAENDLRFVVPSEERLLG